jgi:aromatic-L-amino-acid/L-tryptophan decarboxylase
MLGPMSNSDLTPAEFRRLGHALIEWIAEYRERVATLPVMSAVRPGAIRQALPTAPPLEGGTLDTIVEDLNRVVLPGVTHWNHPRFFAYFPSNSALSSVLAELVTAGLGAQTMSWQTSPAAAELEEVMMDWLRQMTGLPETFTGVIQDAGSTSTLVSLLCARERSTGHSQQRAGLQGEAAALVVYTSDQAHSSVEKAARLAGFGAQRVRLIPTDDHHAMRVDALREAIARDLAAGLTPCAIVATIGTTATTAIDPVPDLADVAATRGLWLHVDACLAGTAMILPECRALFRGLDRADSLVWNPHKWLGTTFDFSAYYVRDPDHLVRVMSTNPSYLQTTVDGQVRNYRDWGIPLGRRFRALKLWFLLREQGVAGLQARVRRDLANAQWLAQQVDAAPGWQRVAPCTFQTVCVRHVPAGMSEAQVDAHNHAWAEALNRSGTAYVTTTQLKGRVIVRLSIGALQTERADVEALWQHLQQAVG